MDTNKRFKKLRITLNYNQLEFAKILGTSQQVISAIERGKYGISKDVEHSLRVHFPDADIDYICGITDYPVGSPGSVQHVAADAIPLITRHNQYGIAKNINNAEWIYQQPRVISDQPINGQYLAIEMPDNTMTTDTPASIIPGDVVIGALMNTIKTGAHACFAIAEGMQVVFGSINKETNTSIEIAPANNIYDPVTIAKDAIIKLYRIIELHTRRHAL